MQLIVTVFGEKSRWKLSLASRVAVEWRVLRKQFLCSEPQWREVVLKAAEAVGGRSSCFQRALSRPRCFAYTSPLLRCVIMLMVCTTGGVTLRPELRSLLLFGGCRPDDEKFFTKVNNVYAFVLKTTTQVRTSLLWYDLTSCSRAKVGHCISRGQWV